MIYRGWTNPRGHTRRGKAPLAISFTAVLLLLLVAVVSVSQAQDRQTQLTLDLRQVRYQLDGFGGNYCFEIESPVTQYTLSHLRIAWARTEMSLNDWEPANDNDSPDATNWEYLASQDQAGSKLRAELLLARQLQDMGIPYVSSVWWLPEWLYAEPGKPPNTHHRRGHPDKWPELLECIRSYLLYARRQYGVEPDLFSFNEPNLGVMVFFSAQEHCEAIKRIGAQLERLGLKTRMLLADATGPRGTHTYAQVAAADPEAMQYVGAVGFHSWGGASPEQYAAWADLAADLNLPLLVTELGVDPHAWRTRSFESFDYALRELRMYQELLLYARPQATMQWEFTSDYSILKEEADETGRTKLLPTARFHFVKHFCNLTPPGVEALSTTSDDPEVLFTAFVGPADTGRVYTLHIANLRDQGDAIISGLPTETIRFRAIRTTQDEGFRELEPVLAHNGTVQVGLAAHSLLTLTTMPAEGS